MPNSSYRQQNVDIRGGYTPYILRPFDMAKGLRETVLARNEQYEKTAEQRRLMENGMSALPLAAEESEYKANLLKQAQDEINKNPRDVSRAMEIGSNLLNNQELRAKSKYYTQREEVRKNLEQRQGVSSKTAEWWWSKHKYHFQPITDDNGNVVGGQEFNPTDLPLDDIKWTEAMTEILRFAQPSSSKSTWQKSSYSDNTGGSTGGGKSNMSLPAKDISAGMRKWINDNIEAVKQSYDVARWQYDTNKERLSHLDKNSEDYKSLSELVAKQREIFETNDVRQGFDKYVDSQINPKGEYITLAAYTRTETDSHKSNQKFSKNSGDGGQDLTELKQVQQQRVLSDGTVETTTSYVKAPPSE